MVDIFGDDLEEGGDVDSDSIGVDEFGVGRVVDSIALARSKVSGAAGNISNDLDEVDDGDSDSSGVDEFEVGRVVDLIALDLDELMGGGLAALHALLIPDHGEGLLGGRRGRAAAACTLLFYRIGGEKTMIKGGARQRG